MPGTTRPTARDRGVEDFLAELLHIGNPRLTRKVALSARTDDGWREITYGELDRSSRTVAGRLTQLGVGPATRVAIVAEPSPEWCVAFLAIVRAGGTVVPIDTRLTDVELADIVVRAQPALTLCSSALLSSGHVDRSAAMAPDMAVVALDDVVARGDPCPALVADRPLSDVAVLVYTSGTTGTPRGVMLSFDNLAYQVRTTSALYGLTGDEVFLSILPLSHTFELTCGLLTVLDSGGEVAYCGSLLPDVVTRAMAEKHVTGMVVVPLFLKLLRRRIESEVARSPRLARTAFRLAGQAAARVRVPAVQRRLFAPVLERLGGSLRAFYVGGAPLDADLANFCMQMGIAVYQGYGLTETSPIVSTNTATGNRLGSVGRPLPGVQVRIDTRGNGDGDGEICVRGPNLMMGYYNDDASTRESVDDEGWLHTGDLGRVDEDGFLYVTGRRKNLIVLASGQKVQPEEVEGALEQSSLIAEACVLARRASVGLAQGSEEVTAVVVPSELCRRQAADLDSLRLHDLVEAEVRARCTPLAVYKRPTRIVVWDEELPKTAIRKVRRDAVAALVAS